MEPALPFIYLPPAMYEIFAKAVNDQYASFYPEPICNPDTKTCSFKKSCDQVDGTLLFLAKLNDNKGGTYLFSLDSSFLKIQGDKMNLDKDRCYIPIFNHGMTGPSSQTIIIGNILLQKYYIVYDMSPLEEANGKDYIQVAFGFRSKDNVLRAQ